MGPCGPALFAASPRRWRHRRHRRARRPGQERGAQGADALALSPTHSLFAADPGALRALLALEPAVPQSAVSPIQPLVFGAAPRRRRAAQRAAERQHGALIDWPAAARAQVRPAAPAVRRLRRDQRADAACGRLPGFRARRRRSRCASTHCSRRCMQHWFGAPEPKWRLARLARRTGARRRAPRSTRFAARRAPDDRSSTCSCNGWRRATSRAAQRGARDAGMRIGLIADLAVGMIPAAATPGRASSDLCSV